MYFTCSGFKALFTSFLVHRSVNCRLLSRDLRSTRASPSVWLATQFWLVTVKLFILGFVVTTSLAVYPATIPVRFLFVLILLQNRSSSEPASSFLAGGSSRGDASWTCQTKQQVTRCAVGLGSVRMICQRMIRQRMTSTDEMSTDDLSTDDYCQRMICQRMIIVNGWSVNGWLVNGWCVNRIFC